MVLQMPFFDKSHAFAASSSEDEKEACGEVQTWAQENGYQVEHTMRTFTTYSGGIPSHHWLLLERPDLIAPSGTEH